jgi:hypothetical protein
MKNDSFWRRVLPLLLCGYTVAAGAAQESMTQGPTSVQTSGQTPGNTQRGQAPADKLLASGPLLLRGTLGNDQVQASLRAKADPNEGFEGDYFLFGHSQKVLLAGEIEGADIFMEESINGTDVSGQWNGKLDGNVVSGTWQSADGLVTKPFTIKIMRISGQPAHAATDMSGLGKQ